MKVQTKGLEWEAIILSETASRVRETSIEKAISDLFYSCLFASGNGIVVTSFYPYGTLLQLCANNKRLLTTKSTKMKEIFHRVYSYIA